MFSKHSLYVFVNATHESGRPIRYLRYLRPNPHRQGWAFFQYVNDSETPTLRHDHVREATPAERWLHQYYPHPAAADMTDIEALEHSILKWSGLQPAVLRAYGLDFRETGIVYDPTPARVLRVNQNTCALCAKYFDDGCDGCPLNAHVGDPCGAAPADPYSIALTTGNVTPMLEALSATLEALRAPTYACGQRFRHAYNRDTYMIASPAPYSINLINLRLGARVRDPVPVKNILKITPEEMERAGLTDAHEPIDKTRP